MKKKNWLYRLKNIGPGAIVVAAFIGPGTITVCSTSGASYGYTLLWVLLFATVATIVFQEMAARLGIITHKGLGENIREKISNKAMRMIVSLIVVVAIFIGNIAYETGNMTGGAMGIAVMLPDIPLNIIAIIMGIIAMILLFSGSYQYIEKFLTALVFVMAFTFIITTFLSQPDWGKVLSGFIPSFQDVNWLNAVGLVGTTVVPYNLFLHSSSAAQRWQNEQDLSDARIDTILSIGLGGIVSMCIVIVSATNCAGVTIQNASDLSLALQPVLGQAASYLVSIGLFAAGLTSTITAPLAAAYATCGVLGIKQDMKSTKFRLIWLIVILAGMIFILVNQSTPTELILIAQVANAVILPIMVIFLMYCMNSQQLGQYRNHFLSNIAGSLVLLITIALCIQNMMKLL